MIVGIIVVLVSGSETNRLTLCMFDALVVFSLSSVDGACDVRVHWLHQL
jgi:hypothetical protein